MVYTYDQDLWELIITLDGAKYTYHDVSPYHWRRFRTLLKKNLGKAMAFIRKFQFTKEA